MDAAKKYAWVFGVLGGLGVLVFLGHRFVMGTSDTPFMVVGGIGGALLALYLFLDKDDVGKAATARTTVYSSGAILMVALAAGILIAVNVLAKRYDERWDWTKSQAHTLSEQSVQTAQSLDEPIQVVAFFGAATVEESSFEDLFENYDAHTDQLELAMYDPMQEPLLAEQWGITSAFGTLILIQGDRQQRLENDFGEEAFTNALINLRSGTVHTLCFTEGHGERGVDDDYGEDGYGGIVIKLEGTNYQVLNFSPLREGNVPAECESVVVAGPQIDFLDPEREVLARYIVGGGSMLVLLDPLLTPELASDMTRYGIAVGADVLIEDNPAAQLQGMDASYLIAGEESFDLHPITTGAKLALFRLVRSVSAVEGAQGVQVQVIARSSPASWGETGLGVDEAPVPNVGELGVGPTADQLIGAVPFIAVSEVVDPTVIEVGSSVLPGSMLEELGIPTSEVGLNAPGVLDTPVTEAGGRVVVFGDADFASNSYMVQGNNQDLFLNSLAWLVGEEDQISIRTNESGKGTLTMSTVEFALSLLVSLLIVPGLLIGAAVLTWARRRKL
ncbi:MAG: GldG family protein [Proteobacteria bacterium]|nr:GldG family protein [Pseudomonadota bacterium]MCP4917142.1 GldG family protein [Pseudomonadota bacterium]